MPPLSEELFIFDDEVGSPPPGECPGWRVLIVDDEQEVHQATVFALERVQVLGRRLEFLHAGSAAEARRVLESVPDIAVVLLDVVMEKEDSGLALVRQIRTELGLADLRIILRTAQAGYVPEIEAIRDYDINDYRTKSELTRTRLYTTLTAAIRAYDQLRAVNASRRGLEAIVRGSAELMRRRSLEGFAAGVIGQLAELLGLPAAGMVCSGTGGDAERIRVIAAAGRFADAAGGDLDPQHEAPAARLLARCLAADDHAFAGGAAALHIGAASGRALAVYVELGREPQEIEWRLLEVFCSTVAVCAENLGLFERLHAFAYVDQLLGLPNRTSFVQSVERRIAAGQRVGTTLALIDLDHFSETNDAFGHRYGDLMLRAVACRLASLCCTDTVVARVSSDTFAVLGPQHLVEPRRLGELFAAPFVVDGAGVQLSASIGLARLADIEGGGTEALKDANIALNRAKAEQRGGHVYYDPEMGADIRDRVRLLYELRSAFERERLFLAYQPQVALDSGQVIGAEALIRWRTEDGRFVPPDRFISLAEYSGLIVGIGKWVLRMACRQLVALERRGFHGFRMAVNVSVAQFRHPDFMATLDAAIADSGIEPSRLELEITESVAMCEPQTMIGLIDAIKQRGVTVAIDDFGTGFSSLAYLQQLHVDRLKIDRAFVAGVCSESGSGRSIARMVAELGRSLGLTVIAEGVENAGQAASLAELGCHEAQGYHFARPMDSETLLPWLTERFAPAVS